MGKAIAIDGPAAAGKSTVAKALANALDYLYIDTGALYRTIGLYCYNRLKNLNDPQSVCALLPKIKLELKHLNGVQRVFLNGSDVSEEIRKPEMSMAASNVSAIPQVREFLLSLQRDIASENNVVMDGRDIGTVVLPNADVKFFLTASAEVRAMRRFKEFEEKGQKVDFEQLLQETKQRDYNDSHRAAAPLKQADDAVFIDSSELTLAQTVEKMRSIVEEKL